MTKHYLLMETFSASDFLRVLTPGFGFLSDAPSGSTMLFRGVAGKHPLVATGFRVADSSPSTVAQVIGRQMTEFENFCTIADREGLRIPGESIDFRLQLTMLRGGGASYYTWPSEQFRPALALAQHYGLPTPLLDFTRNPLVAAYFAAESAQRATVKDNTLDITVWAVEWNGNPLQSMNGVAFVDAPMADNSNMRAQEGCFLFKPVPQDLIRQPESPFAFSGMESELAANYPKEPTLFRLTLPATMAGELLHLLSLYGVRAARLFPGYDGVSREVRERNCYTRNEAAKLRTENFNEWSTKMDRSEIRTTLVPTEFPPVPESTA